ncbi:MAG: MaoC family dehydratase, partial [Elusimicrobiota bacterium]
MSEPLCSRRFTRDDSAWFAAASGDHNPLHLDPAAARRSPIGEVVTHGVHALLWCLESHCASGGGPFSGLSASFLKPVLLDRDLVVERGREGDRWCLSLRSNEETLVYVVLGPGSPSGREPAPPGGPMAAAPPRERAFGELAGDSATLPLRVDG